MNSSNVNGKWNEIKGEIRSMWGNLTGDDLESTKGNVESIVGLIQQKYGTAKDDIKVQVKTIFNRFEEEAKIRQDSALRKANQKTEQLKENLRK